jgi:hypothetical protein
MSTRQENRPQSVAELAAALGPFANPRDRQSIDITARVLGESLAPPKPLPSGNTNPGQATVMLPSTATPQTGAAQTNAQTGPTLPPFAGEPAAVTSASRAADEPSTPDARKSSAPAVPAVTTHALTTSSISEKPKRSPLPMIGGALAVLALAGGGFFAFRKDPTSNAQQQPPGTPTGLVATTPAAPADPQPSATATSTTTILPGAAAPAAPEPSPAAVGAAAPRPNPVNAGVRPATSAPTAPAKSATPSTIAAGAVTAAHPAASTPAAAPAASTKSNPLQMGIK